MPSPSYTYTLTNGTTADASQVMQNFNDILNGVTDGTKNLSISALTCAGTATLNGDVNIGDASADTLTILASLGASIPIKTDNSYDIGTTSLRLRALYGYTLNLGTTSSTTGITLNNNTASYTPAILNYYEEYTYSIQNADLTPNTGAGTFSVTSGTLRVTRIGKIVCVFLDGFTTTTASSVNGIVLQGNAAIPTRLRPNATVDPGMTFGHGVGGNGIYWRFDVIQSSGNIVLSTRDNTGANTVISNAAYTTTVGIIYSL